MYGNKNDFLNHILEPEKKLLMRQILDKIDIAQRQKREVVSDFLDPYEVNLSRTILNRFSEISYYVDGGYQDSERSVIYIYPEYIVNPKNEEISIFELKIKNGSIKHKDVLGTLISLGIDRRKIGDIIFNQNVFNIFVRREISDYIYFNLKKIKNYPIHISEIKRDNIINYKPEYMVKKVIVNSLRADALISSIYSVSRNTAQNLITSRNLKVNFKYEDKPSFLIKEKDIMSIKGKGRAILDEVLGQTKKDKFILKIKIPK